MAIYNIGLGRVLALVLIGAVINLQKPIHEEKFLIPSCNGLL